MQQTLSSVVGSEGQYTVIYNNKSIDERKALDALRNLPDAELAKYFTYKPEEVDVHGAPEFTVSPKYSKWEIKIIGG